MKTNKYILKIFLIIVLTNIAIFFSVFIKGKMWGFYSYALASLASAINFGWQAYALRSVVTAVASESQKKALFGFYFRYLFIALYSFVLFYFLEGKLDILFFGFGLLSSQVSIYIESSYRILKRFIDKHS